MKNIFFVILFIFAFSIFAEAQNDSLLGNRLIEKMFAHRFAEAETYFDESIKTKIDKKILEQVVTSLETSIGKYKQPLGFHQQTDSVYNFLFYYSEFEKTKMDLKFTFNKNHKVLGFFLVEHQNTETLKPEADNTFYTNSVLKIPSKTIVLSGTLTQPKIVSDGKKIIAVLVHGSGPNDRDETVGINKPFKDIAEGLAKNGINVFRYDKRTFSAPESLNPNKLTIDDEVTDDVVNIVRFLKKNDSLHDTRIFVIGHSLGAMLAPRIALVLGDTLAGVVMMAANARPLEVAALEQIEYLLHNQPTEDMKKFAADFKHRLDYLHSAQFDKDSPTASLPFNTPASYWMSLHVYDQVATLKQLTLPILILQGERDYQVTMTDFKIWQNATAGNKNVRTQSYPKLNHLFMPGEGNSVPAEYMIANHIPDAVINEMAEWMKGQ